MSAGFCFNDDVIWGTNGSVEAYVEALGAHAAARFGADDALAVFFREELEGFFPGKVVFLDDFLNDRERRQRFLEVLDAATDQLLRDGGFTEYGLKWVATAIAELRARVAASTDTLDGPGHSRE